MVVINVYIYIYGVKIIKNSGEKVVFLGGVPWNPLPLSTNGSAGYLTCIIDCECNSLRNCRLTIQ